MRFSDKNGSQSLEIEDLDIRRLFFFAFSILFVKLVFDQAINCFRRVETFNRKPRIVRAGAQLASVLVLEKSEIKRKRASMLQRLGRFNRNSADLKWCSYATISAPAFKYFKKILRRNCSNVPKS